MARYERGGGDGALRQAAALLREAEAAGSRPRIVIEPGPGTTTAGLAFDVPDDAVARGLRGADPAQTAIESPAMSIPLALAVAASAASFADLDAIDRAVAGFTGEAVGMPGGASAPVDRRLRLNRCADAARAVLAHAATRYGASSSAPMPAAGGCSCRLAPRAAPVERPRPAVNRGDAVAIAVSGDGFSVSQPGEALEAGRRRRLDPGPRRSAMRRAARAAPLRGAGRASGAGDRRRCT